MSKNEKPGIVWAKKEEKENPTGIQILNSIIICFSLLCFPKESLNVL
jgi:hypothetical protein